MRNLSGFEPRRILVCQQRQLGDVLLATPALELLRRRYPGADLHLFTEAKCEPLIRHNPHVHALHLVEKNLSFPQQIAWYRQVAGSGFDLTVDFQQLPRCRMMTRFSRARVRLSFRPAWPTRWIRPFLYTHTTVPHGTYAAETKASVLAPLGIIWKGELPRLWLTEEERSHARDLLSSLGLKDGQRLITVDATHRRASKRWPADRFAETMDRLHRQAPDLRFFLLRGPGEDGEVRALRERCACREAVLLPDHAPDLRLSAAVMEQATLHLGACSAPRHIAVAVGTPSVVIPGASGPEWTAGGGRHVELRPTLPCAPCHRTDCEDPRCLTLVTPDQVERAVLDRLAQGKAL